LYSRSLFQSENRSLRNCAKYVSNAAAQEAFLKAGGSVEYVGKGKSGQVSPTGSKQISLKK
ncbi:hypothetical protein, partial [Marinobacter adhaerens]|uniref:hypothetical protein n=1 Tax=Marinobacter adhaerens TaxID=1033846 RepID=UPI003C6765FF